LAELIRKIGEYVTAMRIELERKRIVSVTKLMIVFYRVVQII